MQQSQPSCPTINKCDVDVLIMEQLSPNFIEAAKNRESLTSAVKGYFEELQKKRDLSNNYLACQLLSEANQKPHIMYVNNNQGGRIIISDFSTKPSLYGSEPQEPSSWGLAALYNGFANYFSLKSATDIKHASGYSATITQRRAKALMITNLPHNLTYTSSSVNYESIQKYLSTAPEVRHETSILATSNTQNKPTVTYATDGHNSRIIMTYYDSEEGKVPYNSGSEGNPAQSGELLLNRANSEAATHMKYIKDKTV